MKLSTKDEWFVSPLFDTFFLINIPILLLFPIIGIAQKHPLLPLSWIPVSLDLLQGLILSHFIVTAGIIYFDRNETRNKTIFFIIPLLLIAALLFTRYSLGLTTLTSTFLYYAVVVHEYVQ